VKIIDFIFYLHFYLIPLQYINNDGEFFLKNGKYSFKKHIYIYKTIGKEILNK
jgi:hypothetical protein